MTFRTLNIYCWSPAAQNLLLTELLGPTLEEAWQQERIRFFFFDRYDSRGPHLFLVLGMVQEQVEGVVGELSALLELFLAERPCGLVLSPEELQARHAACRGRFQNSLDLEPGLASNNTFLWGSHPETGYPLDLGRDLIDARPLLRWMTEQSFWAIRQIAARGGGVAQGAAFRLLASVDTVLLRLAQDREAFWRYYNTTLLMDLETRLAKEVPVAVANSLATVLSENHRTTFLKVWNAVAQPGGETEVVARWVEELFGADPPPVSSVENLRALCHTATKQLGLLVIQEIPIVIYAWRRCFEATLPD